MTIAAIMGLFTSGTLWVRIAAWAALSAAVALAYASWHHKVFTDGREYESALIAVKDGAAVQRALDMRNKIRSCNDAGRIWDRVNLVCLELGS